MKVDITYLNERVELFDGVYGEQRAIEMDAVARLYNRTIGPITGINLVRPEETDLSLYSAYCRHSPVDALITDPRLKAGATSGPVPGGGKGATMLRPLLGAMGEMTERLLATLHFTGLIDRLRHGTHAEMVRAGCRALGPDEISLFSRQQYAKPGFPYVPFAENSRLGWVEGTELLTGAPIWVPAQLVLMYYRRPPHEPSIGYATTAGLAFQTTRRRAVLHGLFEVIERDALNIRWYSGLTPAKVAIDLREIVASGLDVPCPRVAAPHVDVEVLDLTIDGPVPVLATIGIDRSKQERAFLGGTGADGRREEALAQALFELGQCQTGFHFEDPFGRLPIPPDTDLADVIAFFDAPLYYGHVRNLVRTRWFCAGDEKVGWEDLPTMDDETAGHRILGWMRKGGFNPIVFDFGDACPPGAAITKVYIPGLSQACPPANPMLGHRRFYDLPRERGFSDRRLTWDDLNPDPIPFA